MWGGGEVKKRVVLFTSNTKSLWGSDFGIKSYRAIIDVFSILTKSFTQPLNLNSKMELDTLVGKIVYGFVRTEFILSQMLFEMGMREEGVSFFAEQPISEKLKKLKLEVQESMQTSKNEEFISLIDKFLELNDKRNVVVHSLVLQSTNENKLYRFFKYRKVKGRHVERVIQDYTLKDLEGINDEITKLHNDFYVLAEQLSSDQYLLKF